MDKKKKIELEVLNISNSQEQAGAYALVLGEVEGTRQLPVIIGAAEAQAMLISLKGIIPPRPLTHNLFASCLEVLGVNMMRALIYRVDNGVFYSYIYLKADDAIIRVVRSCVCGSDLWAYSAGDSKQKHSINDGHEAIGIVEEVGESVTTVKPGDFRHRAVHARLRALSRMSVRL